MTKHICQGTKCHTYDTQSRIRGVKGSKVLRTRCMQDMIMFNRKNSLELNQLGTLFLR
jgi:hypothetical protein